MAPFEISFIHRASSLRQSTALFLARRFLFFSVCSHLFVYISSAIASLPARSDIEDKKERCSRRRCAVGPRDRSLLLLAYAPIPAGRRESYEAPFGRSRGDSRISSSPFCEFCFNFRVSPRRTRRSETHVKLLRGVMLIIRVPLSPEVLSTGLMRAFERRARIR